MLRRNAINIDCEKVNRVLLSRRIRQLKSSGTESYELSKTIRLSRKVAENVRAFQQITTELAKSKKLMRSCKPARDSGSKVGGDAAGSEVEGTD